MCSNKVNKHFVIIMIIIIIIIITINISQLLAANKEMTIMRYI